ncbi:MAG TPA: hypothetical protein VNA25_16625 [Phycisphaerae bacterium]|nr:hypothetical protein [Phycisphaerae bacterium]
MSTTVRNALDRGLGLLCLTVLLCGVAAASEPTTRPREKQAPPRAVHRLNDIALTDTDLKALGLKRVAAAPEPQWARPFRQGWFAMGRSEIQVLALREPNTGQIVHYGVVLYPSAWAAQAALDVYRSQCNMGAPIMARPKTGDRCWGGTVVKENVVIYAIRSGRDYAQDITAALVGRIDAALKTPPKALAARDAEAQQWLKIADERMGSDRYTPERAAAVRKFVAAAQEVPWRHEAVRWLCAYRALGKAESPWSADRDVQAILAWPDGPAAVEATLLGRVLGLVVGRGDANWLAARYARDCPKAWKRFAERVRTEYPENRRLQELLDAAGKTVATLPPVIDPTTGLDPRTATLAAAVENWITLLEKDDLKAACHRWAADEQVDKDMAERWAGLRKANEQHDYRKWLDKRMEGNKTGAKAIGEAKAFHVGGHEYHHLHVVWRKTPVGWRIVRVWICR